jgi:hypothetical protein
LQGTAAGFDRAAWSALLQPLVKLWDQLLALAPPALRQTIISNSSSSLASAAAASSSSSSQLGPVDSFVALERAFGVALLQLVARTMAGVKGVLAGEAPTAAVQVSTLRQSCHTEGLCDECATCINPTAFSGSKQCQWLTYAHGACC